MPQIWCSKIMNLLKKGLWAMAFFCLITSCSKDQESIVEEVNYSIDLNLAQETNWQMADAILALVNEHRATLSLPPIKRDQQYASAYAVEHTKYMIDISDINHDHFQYRADALKERGALIVGENVAFGYNTAEAVVHAWLNSEGHRKIIEGEYTHSGFGVMQNTEGNYYFTQLFYRK